MRCTATEQALRVRRPGALDSFARTCTKLHAFNLTEFERVVLLDADTLVVGEGVDALFDERATLAATFDSGFAEHFNTGVLSLAPSAELFATFAELALTAFFARCQLVVLRSRRSRRLRVLCLEPAAARERPTASMPQLLGVRSLRKAWLMGRAAAR